MKKIENRKSKIENFPAFTLIELLVVIAIMAILAAFTFPVLTKVKEGQYRSVARGELEQIATALEGFKAAYGTYPPGNPGGAVTNQLYYELSGTTNRNGIYSTLDGSAQVSANPVTLNSIFGVSGFVNSDSTSKVSKEDAQMAKSFLPGLKPNQYADLPVGGDTVRLLVTSVRGPDISYLPVGVQDVNPFRYNSANPTNNPSSYDLWVDLRINGRTNRIGNWSKQYQIIQ